MEARVAEHEISITLTDAAREWLAREGFDPEYGARPLRRTVQRYVEDPLSRKILSGELSKGDEVTVDAGEDGLTFVKAETEAAVATPV